MRGISATIITKNEDKNIERCLKSVQWVDEIVVVDSGSTDRTLEICNRFRCNVIVTKWLGFGLTKKLAVDSACHDWIFSIDADEEVTDALKNTIQNTLRTPQYNGYRIKRKSFYLDKMIRYCGWNHDYPLRLFNRKFGSFKDKPIHESIKISGKVGKIEEPILHYTYPTIHSHLERMNRYSELGAEQLFEKGKSSSIPIAVLRGIAKFIKMYFLQKGFLDGKVGFILAYNSAYGVYLKYLKLWKMNQ